MIVQVVRHAILSYPSRFRFQKTVRLVRFFDDKFMFFVSNRSMGHLKWGDVDEQSVKLSTGAPGGGIPKYRQI